VGQWIYLEAQKWLESLVFEELLDLDHLATLVAFPALAQAQLVD
jgi:hypothetical protein